MQPTSILLKNLEPIVQPIPHKLEDYAIYVEMTNTKTQKEFQEIKFDSKNLYFKSDKIKKPDIIEESVESPTPQEEKKTEKKVEKKKIKSESETNAVYRVKVKLDGNKTQNFILKDVKTKNGSIDDDKRNDGYLMSQDGTIDITKISLDEDVIICRVGNDDEIIERESIESIF